MVSAVERKSLHRLHGVVTRNKRMVECSCGVCRDCFFVMHFVLL